MEDFNDTIYGFIHYDSIKNYIKFKTSIIDINEIKTFIKENLSVEKFEDTIYTERYKQVTFIIESAKMSFGSGISNTLRKVSYNFESKEYDELINKLKKKERRFEFWGK